MPAKTRINYQCQGCGVELPRDEAKRMIRQHRRRWPECRDNSKYHFTCGTCLEILERLRIRAN